MQCNLQDYAKNLGQTSHRDGPDETTKEAEESSMLSMPRAWAHGQKLQKQGKVQVLQEGALYQRMPGQTMQRMWQEAPKRTVQKGQQVVQMVQDLEQT